MPTPFAPTVSVSGRGGRMTGSGSPAIDDATSKLRDRAQAALERNAEFLALPSPTGAQSIAQVRALTRQTNGLIRLLLGLLNSTEDT